MDWYDSFDCAQQADEYEGAPANWFDDLPPIEQGDYPTNEYPQYS